MRALMLAVSLVSLALAVNAQAHFALTAPPSVGGDPNGKGAPPCGPDTAATGPVTAVTGGQPLTVHIDETVGHAGFYRFALALKSVSEFPADALVRDSNGNVIPVLGPGTSATADYETTPKFPVIADDVFAHSDMMVQSFPSAAVPGQVVLPNVNCDKCILQVEEFMADHGSNGVAGYFYHHCAYLKITADPGLPVFDPNAAAGGAGGASSAGAGGTPAGGASIGGSAGTSVAGADVGGSSGAASAGAGGATSLAGASGGPVSGASSGAGGSAAMTSGATSTTEPAAGGDDGGCSLSSRSAAPNPALALLLGLLHVGARRRRARGMH